MLNWRNNWRVGVAKKEALKSGQLNNLSRAESRSVRVNGFLVIWVMVSKPCLSFLAAAVQGVLYHLSRPWMHDPEAQQGV